MPWVPTSLEVLRACADRQNINLGPFAHGAWLSESSTVTAHYGPCTSPIRTREPRAHRSPRWRASVCPVCSERDVSAFWEALTAETSVLVAADEVSRMPPRRTADREPDLRRGDYAYACTKCTTVVDPSEWEEVLPVASQLEALESFETRAGSVAPLWESADSSVQGAWDTLRRIGAELEPLARNLHARRALTQLFAGPTLDLAAEPGSRMLLIGPGVPEEAYISDSSASMYGVLTESTVVASAGAHHIVEVPAALVCDLIGAACRDASYAVGHSLEDLECALAAFRGPTGDLSFQELLDTVARC